MHDDTLDVGLQKARAFFTRAEEVASTDNFDYAIDLYIDGLRFAPDALEDGHAPLRKLALIREGKGGKKPSMLEIVRHKGGKMPLDEMLNAEFLLAKDPDHLGYAETMLKAAVAGGYHRTGEWIALLVFEANKASDKPSFATYILLKDAYVKMQLFAKAVSACDLALQLRPNDGQLQNELRNLCASMTMEKGKYGKTADFRGSISNKEAQDRLHSQESFVKSADTRQQAVQEARKRIEEGRFSPVNVIELADALADLESEAGYKEAFETLEKFYAQSQDFSFRRRLGELKMRYLRAKIRVGNKLLKTEPENAALKDQLAALTANLERLETEHYRLCQENYPTDMRYKYEYGRCLVRAKQFDQAIPLFQEAQKDPKLHLAAMDKAGLCFLLKGWYEDAIDIFQRALKACPTEDNAIAKDITYNLARAYEASDQTSEALNLYRKIAQLDFSYKDVGQRIDILRKDGKR
ncbi:MAG: hypothetical protein GXY41_02150 [Phycisphaerae bacterium]|nr:hypothetical protein [Phycisphaerae bacterium]